MAPFITNIQAGDHSIPHSREEDELCKACTMEIGYIIYEKLEKIYDFDYQTQ
jgi:hypothetical protein